VSERPRCPTCGHLTSKPRGRPKRKCKLCGLDFVPFAANAVFCSDRCRTVQRSEDAQRKRLAVAGAEPALSDSGPARENNSQQPSDPRGDHHE
jgi:predicted nucleic acid-binding Zn ribbon protein